MPRIDSLYVSITTPEYAPSMAETLAKVVAVLIPGEQDKLIGVEPVYGVWRGERENTVKLTFEDLAPAYIWIAAESYARDFGQEAVLWVTDTAPYLENFSPVHLAMLTDEQIGAMGAYTETLEGIKYAYVLHHEPTHWATLVDAQGNKNKLS